MASKNKYSLMVKVALVWFVLIPVTAMVNTIQAQTFSEFFKQKKTQKKYLLKQIAALQVYLGYIKDGYRVASSGLQTITGFTRGEFNLHSAFISSLNTVSPFIRNHTKVADILALELSTVRLFNKLKQDNGTLSPGQKDYIRKVHNEVSADNGSDLDELFLVITSGKIEMTEDQRLERLDKIYQSTRKRFEFTQQFATDVNILKEHKKSELKSTSQIRDIYGNTN